MNSHPLRRAGASLTGPLLLCVGVLLSLAATPVCGQTAGGATSLALPDAPAFSFLGVTPGSIARPVTPRAFSSSLLNAIDSTGQVLQGIALDVAPWTYIPGLSIPLEAYQTNRLKYALANTQVSLATARAAGDGAATDVGIGLRIALWNRNDPMQDPTFTDSLRAQALRQCLPDQPTADTDAIEECAGTLNQQLRQAWLKENWNNAALEFAAATGWELGESKFSEGEWLGFSAWLTGAAPFTRRGQVVFQVRYDRREAVGAFEATDLFLFGMKGYVGSATFNVFGELAGRHDSEAALSDDKTTMTWSGGVEFQVSNGIWLSTGFGSAFASEEAGGPAFVIANIRWGIGQGPNLSPSALGGAP